MEAGTSLLLGTTELPAEQEPRDSSLDSPVSSRATREFTSSEHCYSYMPLLGACPFICPSSSSPCSLKQAALFSLLPHPYSVVLGRGAPHGTLCTPRGQSPALGFSSWSPGGYRKKREVWGRGVFGLK